MWSDSRTPFLTADWRWLVMLNYEVDPSALQSYVPMGTELDLYQGKCLVSIVGFLFDGAKLFGRVPIPLHASFEEVNLRFYVKRRIGDQTRRGVAFVKELVPSHSVTWVARLVFHENYQRVPMRHLITWNDPTSPQRGGQFEYQWQSNGHWSKLCGKTHGPLADLEPESIAEFIVEHYWGYSKRRDGATFEYAVEHPRWKVWQAESCSFETDIHALCGERFVRPLSSEPHSALIAEGSPVVLYHGAIVP